MVTIQRQALVDLLKAIGFPDAQAWTDVQLAIRAPQVPKRCPLSKVPTEHAPVYALCLTALGLEEPVTIESTREVRKAAAVARAVKREKEKIPMVVDEFGCHEGTISHKVNQVLSNASNWLDEKEVADQAGVTLNQARGRLYYGAVAGHFIKRVRVEYQIARPKPK